VAQIEDWRPLITRYLLGELTEERQREFEESYFASDELFALLLEVEAELIKRYAGGNLSADERERFEKYFLRSAE
jgi:hypothetical protein